MIPYLEITDTCNSCDNCRLLCPENAVLKVEEQYVIEKWLCTMCNICVFSCPVECILPTKDKRVKIE